MLRPEGWTPARPVSSKPRLPRVLAESQQLSETQAYEHMRSRATKLRVTVAEVSAVIIDAHEAMEKLGLGNPDAKS